MVKKSKFDWHCEPLSLKTVIKDSYKNTQKVRRFFKAHVGPDFKFNVALMNWMKPNAGKTLADALEQYHTLKNTPAQHGQK